MNFGYGVPVTFDTFGGFYHAGRADRPGRKAVLLLSPIGYEELCSRATWQALAGMIAASGHVCLSFDYPGTADAIDIAGDPDGIADWLDAARRCVASLREHHPDAELVLVGQGLGASLAALLGADMPDVGAAVLMAPVAKGRTYLRELQAWSRVVTEQMGITPDPLDNNGYTVAGLSLPSPRAEAIQAIDLTRMERAPAAKVLLVERTQTSRESALGRHLKQLGADVAVIDYAGYEQILQNPTLDEPQRSTLQRIVSWIDDLPTSSLEGARRSAGTPMPARPMTGGHYEERPVRFGPDERLFGVLCRPVGQASSMIAILVNSGRDYHIGWGRAAVAQARALAARGIASFRFDAGGIGDSPAVAGAPTEMLYSDGQLAELQQAVDYVDTLGAGPVALVGRCSGAYASFQIAVRDERVRAVVLINTLRFVWDPRETVEDALQTAHRTISGSLATLFNMRNVRRLLTGNLRIKAAGAFVIKRLKQIAAPKPAEAVGLPSGRSLFDEGHHRFDLLTKRGVRVAMVCSEGDRALDELRIYMGRNNKRLRRYPNASLALIPDADHNFTHEAARARLTAALCDVLAETSSQAS